MKKNIYEIHFNNMLIKKAESKRDLFIFLCRLFSDKRYSKFIKDYTILENSKRIKVTKNEIFNSMPKTPL